MASLPTMLFVSHRGTSNPSRCSRACQSVASRAVSPTCHSKRICNLLFKSQPQETSHHVHNRNRKHQDLLSASFKPPLVVEIWQPTGRTRSAAM